jgi:hypothetical protein
MRGLVEKGGMAYLRCDIFANTEASGHHRHLQTTRKKQHIRVVDSGSVLISSATFYIIANQMRDMVVGWPEVRTSGIQFSLTRINHIYCVSCKDNTQLDIVERHSSGELLPLSDCRSESRGTNSKMGLVYTHIWSNAEVIHPE